MVVHDCLAWWAVFTEKVLVKISKLFFIYIQRQEVNFDDFAFRFCLILPPSVLSSSFSSVVKDELAMVFTLLDYYVTLCVTNLQKSFILDQIHTQSCFDLVYHAVV